MGKRSTRLIDQFSMQQKRKRSQSKKTGRRDDESAALAHGRQTKNLVEAQESIARASDQNPPPGSKGEAGRPEHSQFSLAGPQAQALNHDAPSPFSAEIATLRLEAAFFETKAFEFQNKLAKADVELFSVRQELAHAQGRLDATDKKIVAESPYAELMLQALLSHKGFEQQGTVRIAGELSKETYFARDADAAAHEHVLQIDAAQTDDLADLRRSVERMRHRAEDAERRAEEQQSDHNKTIDALQSRLDRLVGLDRDKSRMIAELNQSALTQKSELKDLRSRLLDSKRQLMKNAVVLASLRESVERRSLALTAIKQGRFWRLSAAFRMVTKNFTLAQRMLMARKRPNPLFDAAYYLERYPDIEARGQDPYAHYLRFGADEGRYPNPLFYTKWYYERYPDVKKAGFNALLHYYLLGAAEGRDPHPLFCTKWYLNHHPELVKTGVNALLHFLQSNERLGKGRAAETKKVLGVFA